MAETKIIISAATAQAESAMRSLGTSVDGVSRKFFDLSGIAGTLGGALTITAFAGFIKSNIDAADSLESLRFQTGTAVEDLAGLKFAAEQNSVSLELVAKAGNKLGSTMMDKPEIFKKLGITAKDSTGAMVQLADIFANLPEGMAKTKLAAELMGEKLGPQMVEFLSQGSASLQSYIDQGKKLLPISGESARLAKEFNDQLDRLKTSAGTAGVSLSMAMLPALNDIITQTVRAQKEYGSLIALFAGVGFTGASLLGVELNPQKRAQAELNDMLQKQRDLRKDIALLEARSNSNQPLQREEINKHKQRLAELSPQIKAQIDRVNAPINEAGAAAAQARLGSEERQRLADKKAKELSDALGGDGKNAKKPKEQDTALRNWLWEVDEYHKQRVEKSRAADKAIEDAQQEMRRGALEAQRIIADSDPIYKASLAWEDLSAMVEQGFLTGEQAGQAYAKTFGDVSKSIEEANRIMFDVDPQKRANAEWQELLDLQREVGAEYLSNADIGKAYAKSFSDIDKAGNDAFKSLENAVRGWGNQFTKTTATMLRTGKADFSSLKDSIIQDLLEIQVQKRITDPLVKMGTGLLDGLFGGLFKNASGGVYSGAGISAYSGSVVSQPTVFPFARGVGLMGEAGPEAILPLTRINGKLGVQAQGGDAAAPNIVINVSNQSGQNVNARQQGGPQFDGRDWILGVVLEAADSNPSFRNAMGMAG